MSGGAGAGTAGAGAAATADGGGGALVEFRKVSVGESRLWQTRRIRHADLNRLHLRSMESILDPTVSAESIIGMYVGHSKLDLSRVILPASIFPPPPTGQRSNESKSLLLFWIVCIPKQAAAEADARRR